MKRWKNSLVKQRIKNTATILQKKYIFYIRFAMRKTFIYILTHLK